MDERNTQSSNIIILLSAANNKPQERQNNVQYEMLCTEATHKHKAHITRQRERDLETETVHNGLSVLTPSRVGIARVLFLYETATGSTIVVVVISRHLGACLNYTTTPVTICAASPITSRRIRIWWRMWTIRATANQVIIIMINTITINDSWGACVSHIIIITSGYVSAFMSS